MVEWWENYNYNSVKMGWMGRGHSAKLNARNVWLVRVNFIK